jgi:hypothetical protein
MELNTTAEFRNLSKSKFENLMVSAEYKKVKKGGFFGLFKKVEVIDEFETSIQENTTLLDTISDEGFLLFDHLIEFLKSYKSINLRQDKFSKLILKNILERGEGAYFLDYDYIQEINQKLADISVEKEELMEFNEKIVGYPMSDMIESQQEQINKLSKIFQLFSGELMYIRCESPDF